MTDFSKQLFVTESPIRSQAESAAKNRDSEGYTEVSDLWKLTWCNLSENKFNDNITTDAA